MNLKTVLRLLLILLAFASTLLLGNHIFYTTQKSNAKSTEIRIDRLNRLTERLLEKNDDQAFDNAKKAFALANKSGYIEGKAVASLNLGLFHHSKNNYQLAISHFERALSDFKKSNNKSQMARCQYQLGVSCLRAGDVDEGVRYFRDALPLYQEIEDVENVAATYTNLGYGYWQLSRYDSAYVNYEAALKIRQQQNNSEKIALILNSLGVIHWQWAKYDIALDYYLKSLKIRQELNDKPGIAKVLSNIGRIHQIRGETSKAKEFFTRAFRVSRETDDHVAIGYALNNIGNVYESIQQYDSALVCYERSLQEYQDGNYVIGIALNKNDMSEVYLQKGNYDRAIILSKSAVEISNRTGNKTHKAIAFKNQGSAYYGKKMLDSALEYYFKSLDISREIDQKELILEVFHRISDVYKAKNDYKTALDYHDFYSAFKDSVFDQKTDQKISSLIYKFERDKEKEIHEAKLKRQQIILASVILCLIFAIALIVVTVRSNYLLKSVNKKIQEKSNELEKANAAKDRFFSIIAHDLRSPFNTIVSFINLISKNTNELSKQEILNLTKDLKSNVENTRGLLENLLHWSQSQTGNIAFKPEEIHVAEVIKNSVRELQNMVQSKSVNIDLKGISDYSIKADYHMIKTVMRNLLTNSVKFSQPGGKISVSTALTNNHVEVSITDRGVGMDNKKLANIFQIDKKVSTEGTKGERGSGLGLILCKEFVEMHGGQIHVQSKPDEGSTFSFTIPRSKS